MKRNWLSIALLLLIGCTAANDRAAQPTGPLQLIMQKQKRNPVNINLRRDIGIWAGLTGLAHVIYGFQAHLQGRIVLFFFEETAAGY